MPVAGEPREAAAVHPLQPPPQHDADKGRCQANWGVEGGDSRVTSGPFFAKNSPILDGFS